MTSPWRLSVDPSPSVRSAKVVASAIRSGTRLKTPIRWRSRSPSTADSIDAKHCDASVMVEPAPLPL